MPHHLTVVCPRDHKEKSVKGTGPARILPPDAWADLNFRCDFPAWSQSAGLRQPISMGASDQAGNLLQLLQLSVSVLIGSLPVRHGPAGAAGGAVLSP